MRLCDIEGCGRKHYAKGLCSKHRAALARKENPERFREADRRFSKRHADKIREKNRKHRVENPEIWRERALKYYYQNRAKVLAKAKERGDPKAPARAKAWRQENPSAVTGYTHTRRARLAAGGAYTPEEWRDLCSLYEHRCAKCRKDRKLSVDHIVPISKGGSNYIWNIQPLCIKCNIAKGSLHATYYPPPVYSY